ncbi:hypothetical protein HYPSUDRAFT_201354 [Hypholoma sublateritium FD-334 SS-4]|uniref:Uncharacterized protein n=1 Tax=Hypholoma sublateritium (strain FD-334 SS-4) TaxID=945553 RepID=A0A0D2NWX9_HYPSF|nr:hypothetical protein HYPSUDRAFT_209879 [Hypholoma sublateritium FD-334 SS-4]KJA23323.1 hypothetical protein HYPSUDRAFT_201354 [Hypholoma sublateritium FD-334 SS-4]
MCSDHPEVFGGDGTVARRAHAVGRTASAYLFLEKCVNLPLPQSTQTLFQHISPILYVDPNLGEPFQAPGPAASGTRLPAHASHRNATRGSPTPLPTSICIPHLTYFPSYTPSHAFEAVKRHARHARSLPAR